MAVVIKGDESTKAYVPPGNFVLYAKSCGGFWFICATAPTVESLEECKKYVASYEDFKITKGIWDVEGATVEYTGSPVA